LSGPTSLPIDNDEGEEHDELEKHDTVGGLAVTRPLKSSAANALDGLLRIASDRSDKDVSSQRREQLSIAQALLQPLLPCPRSYPTLSGLLELRTRLLEDLDAGDPGLPNVSDVKFLNPSPTPKSKGGPRPALGGGCDGRDKRKAGNVLQGA